MVAILAADALESRNGPNAALCEVARGRDERYVLYETDGNGTKKPNG